MKREDAIKLMDDEVVTLTARDKEEYYKESKAHRKNIRFRWRGKKMKTKKAEK